MSRPNYLTDTFADFMKRVEGSVIEHIAYRDGGGVWTIGYGHTGADVNASTRWSEAQALDALAKDTAVAYRVARRFVKVELTPNQEAAIISLIYNVGGGAFCRSTALKNLNAGDFEGFMWEAFDAKQGFTKRRDPVTGERVISAGLVKRRAHERTLFTS